MRWTIQLCWHCTTTTVLSRAAPSVRLFLCPRFPPLWSRVLNCGGFAAPGGTEQDWKALRVNPAEVVLTIISSQQTQGKARALLDSWGHQLSRCCFFLVVSIFLDLHPHTDTPTHTHTHTHTRSQQHSPHMKRVPALVLVSETLEIGLPDSQFPCLVTSPLQSRTSDDRLRVSALFSVPPSPLFSFLLLLLRVDIKNPYSSPPLPLPSPPCRASS